MKQSLFILLLVPFLATSQQTLPRYANDTLITISGYKIYLGQTLHFGKGSGRNGKFRFVNIKDGASSWSLANASIVVKELKKFAISALGNGYVQIIGTIIFKDASKGYVDIHIAFDKAIENSPESPAELIVPAEFNTAPKKTIEGEIEKLYRLYKSGAINKTEYEARKKKLIEE